MARSQQQDGATAVSRWLVLDITMPLVFRPLRPLVTVSFDRLEGTADLGD